MSDPLYPLHDLPERENGLTFAQRLEAVEQCSTAELEALQTLHLRHLLDHHGRHTPHWHQRLAEAGLDAEAITSLEELRRLPPLRRAQIQQARDALFSGLVPFDHLPIRTSQTSGSTGEPVRVRRSRLNGLLNEAASLRDHRWWGRPANGGRITMIRPQFKAVAEVPASPGNSRNVAQQIPITTDVGKQLELMAAFQPEVLLVYPSNLAALLEFWQAGAVLPSSLRHLKTIGETVSPSLCARANAVLGLAIEDSYSSEELGAIAVQCPASGLYHVMAESHLVEVLHPDGAPCGPGESGEVVVTDLHNLATPLIRYAIGDWAEVGDPCPCGKPLSTLRHILGRERNLVQWPDGRRHWPLVGFQRFGAVAPVRQYQVIQHSLETVELRLRPERPLQPSEREGLAAIVREALGHPFRVTVEEYSEDLPVGPNGKFEEFVCRVASRPEVAP